MPNTREKLIEILLGKPNRCTFEELADYLIANGVKIPVLCKDCKRWNYVARRMAGLCHKHCTYTAKWDFCSYGEKAESKSENGTKCTDLEVGGAKNGKEP